MGVYVFFDISGLFSRKISESQVVPQDDFYGGTIGVERLNKKFQTTLNLYIPILPGFLSKPRVPAFYFLEKSNYVADFKVRRLKPLYNIFPAVGVYGLRDQSRRVVIGGILNVDYSLTSHFTLHFKSTVDRLQGFKCTLGFTSHYHNYYDLRNDSNLAYKLFHIPIGRYDFSHPSLLDNEEFENGPGAKNF